MKKIILPFACIFLWLHSPAPAQSKQQISQLATLAKVWGFLKYYHPAVAAGTIPWDMALTDQIKKCQFLSPEAFQAAMTDWYASLPKATLAAHKTQPTGDSIVNIFKPAEIIRLNIPGSLKSEFLKLYEYHIPDSNIYFTDKYKNYHLDYLLNTEEAYSQPVYPSAEMRLLALFRYWNVINYFYPHKTSVPSGWAHILKKYIPQFLNAPDAAAYQLAARKLSIEIIDSHAFYNEPAADTNSQHRVPFGLKKVNGRYFINYLFQNPITRTADFRMGDELLSINGKPIKRIENTLKNIVQGSNQQATNRNLCAMLFVTDTSRTAEIKVKRGNLIDTKIVHRYTFKALMQAAVIPPACKQVDPAILYINAGMVQSEDTADTWMNRLKNHHTLIFDLRVYPNFSIINKMMQRLVDSKLNLGINLNGWSGFPGVFVKHQDSFVPDASALHFTGKIIVLVNESTQSLGESIAALLRARKNTVVVGTKTAGTTGNITSLPLPGGIRLSYTGAGFTGAKNSFIQRKGVKLDRKIKITTAGLLSGKDEILEVAIKLAKSTNKIQ